MEMARWESISRTLAEQPEGLPVWSPSCASQRPPRALLLRSVPSLPSHSIPVPFSITFCPVTESTRSYVHDPADVVRAWGRDRWGSEGGVCGRRRDGLAGILTISSMAGPLDKATP